MYITCIKDFKELPVRKRKGSCKIGETYQELTLIKFGEYSGDIWLNGIGFLCKCSCGNLRFVKETDKLKNGRIKDCGCNKKSWEWKTKEFLTKYKEQFTRAGIIFLSTLQLKQDNIPYWCSVHNDYNLISRKSLIKFQHQPCLKCGRVVAAIKRLKTTEQFIIDSKSVWGEDRFTYNNTHYTGSHEDVTITCKEHGDFTNTATDHLSCYLGCKGCSPRSEFDKSKSGELYVVEWEKRIYDFLKFGITNTSTEWRISKQRTREAGITFQPNILHIFKFDSGEECADLELKISQTFETGVVSKEDFPDGFSETVKTSDYPLLLNFIESQLPNYKSYKGTRNAIY